MALTVNLKYNKLKRKAKREDKIRFLYAYMVYCGQKQSYKKVFQ